MLSKFLKDKTGNYSIMTAVLTVPLLGALALGIDYSDMSRQRQATLNALDAAGIATGMRAIGGATDAELIQYANDFFKANLGPVDPAKATLNVVLPSSAVGGGTLKLSAKIQYDPYFAGAFMSLLNRGTSIELAFDATSEIRLKNTLEVALVLDNSGSMDYNGSGTGKKRMVLLKEAAKQLVDTIALQAAQMKQVEKPVQFSLVPFAASVNVGTQHATASWMDVDGRSPIHHENFNWATMSAGNKNVELVGGIYRKTGSGWSSSEKNQKVTRFTLFDGLKRQTGTSGGKPVYGAYASWGGCVETRPHPYAYDVTLPSSGNPSTLFVPMFAPDETDEATYDSRGRPQRYAYNSWWNDGTTNSSNSYRQRYMPKYFTPAATGKAAAGTNQGPNLMCSTTPITPLTDVSTAAGLKKVKDAIDAMQSLGATDVPEGTAWGWRTLASTGPFPHGRPEQEKGNDKVLIVLTDGENTYYTPSYLGGHDLAGNKSVYSNKGYTAQLQDGASKTRLFMGTTVNAGTHTEANFTAAMNQHMDTVCEGAKAAGIIVMTVALDLSTSVSGEKSAIEALTRCASDSRFRRDANDSSKAAKLFWNANGSNLAEKFKEIADELSNLRIVG